jgi:tetratricopeptide (TPR) repeat protein
LAAFAKAVVVAPDNPILLGNLARARLQYAELLEKHGKDPLPQLDASVAELEAVLKRAPGFLRGYPWLAESLTARAAVKRANAGDWKPDVEAAVTVLTKAISLDAAFAEGYRTRGVLYLDLGRKDEARKDLVKAIELRPAWRSQLEPLIPK